MEEVIKDKDAAIKTNNLGNVSVIPSQFVQLFQNLISNSIKYSKPDEPPVITINSAIVPGSKIKNVKLQPENDYCHISFRDNGIGFDRQYRERIFEVFQRLHTKEAYAGTGMGLAICKRIVENHNGVITADGILNKGAKFDIYIPTENEIPPGLPEKQKIRARKN